MNWETIVAERQRDEARRAAQKIADDKRAAEIAAMTQEQRDELRAKFARQMEQYGKEYDYSEGEVAATRRSIAQEMSEGVLTEY